MACAGILVGLINTSGLGLTLADILLTLSHGILPLLLILAMISSIIIGMGVPITASYIVLSVLVVPALVDMGVIPIAAHLFIFYYCVFSGISPPFAPEAFVAGAIAKAPVMKTAVSACKIGLIGLMVPYLMIYEKAFLMMGSAFDILIVLTTSILAIIALGCAINGYLFSPINIFFRIVLAFSAVIMIIPGILTDAIGLGLFCLIAFFKNPTFYVDVPKKYLSLIFGRG